MNSELAKQLKDAGFPQKGLDWYYTKRDGWEEFANRRNYEPDFRYEICFVPTLSELIEAFHSFAKLEHTGRGENEWVAEAWNDAWNKKYKCIGKIPEEAVAKLWLKLNRKQLSTVY